MRYTPSRCTLNTFIHVPNCKLIYTRNLYLVFQQRNQHSCNLRSINSPIGFRISRLFIHLASRGWWCSSYILGFITLLWNGSQNHTSSCAKRSGSRVTSTRLRQPCWAANVRLGRSDSFGRFLDSKMLRNNRSHITVASKYVGGTRTK